MMTRDEVLADMEASFEKMPAHIRTEVLFTEFGTDWTPTLLLEAVRNDTDMGQLYVKSWAQDKEERASMDRLLAVLLGAGPRPEDLTCGDPDCPNCHGEVRPFGPAPDSTPQLH